jgi:7-cyano-7-deazaguanine synthase
LLTIARESVIPSLALRVSRPNPNHPMPTPSLAVLISGGLDSAILLGDCLRRPGTVHPLFMRCGLAWEQVEFAYLCRYLDALRCPALKPLVVLDQPTADLYGTHWSVTGDSVPDAETPDEAVFLPGRNVLLLAKALIWCHLQHVPAVALGSLQTNPFPDATPAFFRGFQGIVNQAVQGSVEVRLPLSGMKKVAVMRLGQGLPLEHTFSCIAPTGELHCGRCNKCAERQHAFADAGMIDPTTYAR